MWNSLKFFGGTNSSTLDPQTNKRSWVTLLNACTHPTISFSAPLTIRGLLHSVHSIIKLVFIACCFDGLNGIPCEFFLVNVFEGRCSSSVFTFKKHLKNVFNGLHCAHQALDWVDGGVFERFAKVDEVVGRFYNSNRHFFNWIEVVALLCGVVQKSFQL